MSRNIKLTIEYDGTEYAGWQAQTNALAIQTVIERALRELLREETRIIGAGRTDAGVHAAGQVANFRTSAPIPTQAVAAALNARLPADIAILGAEEVSNEFHARYDARWRTYRYTILNRPAPSALAARYTWHYRKPLPVPIWNALGRDLVGTHDFASFQKSGGGRLSSICTVRACRCTREKDHVILTITADSFLRGMVRAVVGTFRRIAPDESADAESARARLREILNARDRGAAGESAPAQGLCLVRVSYA